MRPLTCAAVKRRLHAYHDRELAVSDEISVSAHLDWCDRCAEMLSEFELVRATLKAAAPGRAVLSDEEAVAFNQTVVSRSKAEEDASLLASMRVMFADMHLVYAGLGATLATLACLVVMLGMMRFGSVERPDSLAAIVSVLAMPLECQYSASISDTAEGGSCQARWLERFQRANETAEQDAVFTLDSLVNEQGKLANLARLRTSRHRAASGQVKLIEALLDSVSKSRLDMQPVRLPSAANVLWMVARTTVRANKA
jgi:hypothetical protein